MFHVHRHMIRYVSLNTQHVITRGPFSGNSGNSSSRLLLPLLYVCQAKPVLRANAARSSVSAAAIRYCCLLPLASHCFARLRTDEYVLHSHRTESVCEYSSRHAHAPGSSSASCCCNGNAKLKHMYFVYDTWKCGSLSLFFTHPPADFKMNKEKGSTSVVFQHSAPLSGSCNGWLTSPGGL